MMKNNYQRNVQPIDINHPNSQKKILGKTSSTDKSHEIMYLYPPAAQRQTIPQRVVSPVHQFPPPYPQPSQEIKLIKK